ncbi:MAG: TetR/AcrR family transcriptional regulator [Chloroflexota bacterium]|jgi:AcrR family transcriptional regulator|nr:TetR/AcrR family transcriptional regulator [Chloroflexota bacterium]
MSSKTTKEHILLSTIDAIEKHGLMNLTTRLIAEEAGVNNAALHYYFGTKEHLLDKALNQTAYHMLEDTKTILESEKPIDIRICEMFEYIIEGILRFPNIIRAHLVGPLLYTERQTELSFLLKSWVELASEAIKPHISTEKTAQLKLNLNMVFSIILISGLLAGPPEEYGWIDLEDVDERRSMLDYATQQIMG